MKLAEGKEMLAFGMELYEWQARRGKLAIFEHPATSKAWDEEVVTLILERPEVQRVRADQCQFGLAAQGIPNKKPTDFMVNSQHIASKLRKGATAGTHTHQPLMKGIAKLAQEYPRGLCRAMIQGGEESLRAKAKEVWAVEEEANAEERDIEDLLDGEVDKPEESPPGIQSMRERTQDERAQEEPLEEEEDQGPRQSHANKKRQAAHTETSQQPGTSRECGVCQSIEDGKGKRSSVEARKTSSAQRVNAMCVPKQQDRQCCPKALSQAEP